METLVMVMMCWGSTWTEVKCFEKIQNREIIYHCSESVYFVDIKGKKVCFINYDKGVKSGT